MADITISDQNDGTFALAEADRETLTSAVLLTPAYKGGTDTVQYPASTWDNGGITVYDPVVAAANIQSQIDALTAQLTPLQATAAYQASVAQPANPAQPAPAQ